MTKLDFSFMNICNIKTVPEAFKKSTIMDILQTEELSESEYEELSQRSSQSQFQYESDDSDPDYECEDSQPLSSSDCSSQGFSQVIPPFLGGGGPLCVYKS